MMDLSDPDKIHELLIILVLIVMFPTAFVTMGYINVLGAFFRELKEKEPLVWTNIGAPGLLNMMLLPFLRFKKYYAFLPVLRERAARNDGSYQHAGLAYLLLKLGLAMCMLLFALVGIVVLWIIYHGL